MKKIIILLVVFCFGLQLNAQEKYTDEEIGFDKEKVIKTLEKDGLKEKKAIDKTLLSIRSSYITFYEMNNKIISKPIMNRETTVGCGDNIGFENGFTNWCYTRFKRSSTDNNGLPNPGSGNEVPTAQIGGIVCDSLDNVIDNDIEIMESTILPPNNTFSDLDLSSFTGNAIRLGGYDSNGGFIERIEKTIEVSEINRVFTYRYAVILENPGHEDYEQPYFRIFLQDASGSEVPCSRFEATAGIDTGESDGFITIGNNSNFSYKQPAIQSIDLINQGIAVGNEVTIVVEIADCTRTGHFGMAYFEGFCSENVGNTIQVVQNDIVVSGDICLTDNNLVQFQSISEIFSTPQWDLYNNTTNQLIASFNTLNPGYLFTEQGEYRMDLQYTNASGNGDTSCDIAVSASKIFEVIDCPCEDCYSFKPVPGDTYILSAWVKEDLKEQVKTYESSSIEINYLDNSNNIILSNEFFPENQIIEGWQRISKEFAIPNNTVSIEIMLKNNGNRDNYFDDIRIHPYKGSMKSFVYDPQTQRLMAELDGNNYSTFYEYDKEGGLIRVKKETEKGVYTIQETRSKTSTDD